MKLILIRIYVYIEKMLAMVHIQRLNEHIQWLQMIAFMKWELLWTSVLLSSQLLVRAFLVVETTSAFSVKFRYIVPVIGIRSFNKYKSSNSLLINLSNFNQIAF